MEGQTPVEAFKQSFALKQYLYQSGETFKVVSGCFDGKIEISFLITNILGQKALAIAKIFKQVCFLSVDRYREARLVYTDDDTLDKPLGYFIEGGEADGNYTIDNGIKYICTN